MKTNNKHSAKIFVVLGFVLIMIYLISQIRLQIQITEKDFHPSLLEHMRMKILSGFSGLIGTSLLIGCQNISFNCNNNIFNILGTLLLIGSIIIQIVVQVHLKNNLTIIDGKFKNYKETVRYSMLSSNLAIFSIILFSKNIWENIYNSLIK